MADNLFTYKNPLFPDDAATPTDDGATEWSDYGKAAVAGAKDVGAQVMAGTRYVGERLGNEDMARSAKRLEESAREGAEETRKTMTPAAQKAANASVTSQDFRDAPMRSIGLKLAGMTPYVAAAMVPAGIVGEVFGAGAGTAAAFAVGAAQGGGGQLEEVYKRLDATPDDKLQEQSPYYAGLRQRMTEDAARAEYNAKLQSDDGRLLISMVGNGIANTLGAAGQVGRAAGGKAIATETGRLAGAATGATEGMIGGVIGGTASETARQGAMTDAGFQPGRNDQEFASAVIEQLGLGGLTGGVAGGVLHGKGESPAPKKPAVDPAAAAALDATLNPPKAPEAIPTAAPEPEAKAPATPKVDPAQAAALKGALPDAPPVVHPEPIAPAQEQPPAPEPAQAAVPEQPQPPAPEPAQAPQQAIPDPVTSEVTQPEQPAPSPHLQAAADAFDRLVTKPEAPQPAQEAPAPTVGPKGAEVVAKAKKGKGKGKEEAPAKAPALDEIAAIFDRVVAGDKPEAKPAPEEVSLQPGQEPSLSTIPEDTHPVEAPAVAEGAPAAMEARPASENVAVPEQAAQPTLTKDQPATKGDLEKVKRQTKAEREQERVAAEMAAGEAALHENVVGKADREERRAAARSERRTWSIYPDHEMEGENVHPAAKDKNELRKWLNGLTDDQHALLRQKAIWDPNRVPVDTMEPVRVHNEYKRILEMGDAYTHHGELHEPGQNLTPEGKPEAKPRILPNLAEDHWGSVQAAEREKAAVEATKTEESAKHDQDLKKGDRGKLVEDVKDKAARQAYTRRAVKLLESDPNGKSVHHDAARAALKLKELGRGQSPEKTALADTVRAGMQAEVAAGKPIAEVRGDGSKGKSQTQTAKQKAEARAKELAEHFKPGEIVASYGGWDRVLEYKPGKDGRFEVRVRAVDPSTGEFKKGESERVHTTEPSPRNIKETKAIREAMAKVDEAKRLEEARKAEIERLAAEQQEDAKTDKTGRDLNAHGGMGLQEPTAADHAAAVARDEGADVFDALDRPEHDHAASVEDALSATAEKTDAPREEETYQEPTFKPRERPMVAVAADAVTAGKDKAGTFKVEKPKVRTFKRALGGELSDGYVSAQPVRSGTVRSTIAKIDLTRLPGVSSKVLPFIQQRLLKKVGDVPVHVLSDADFDHLHGKGIKGVWQDPGSHEIHVRESAMKGGPEQAHVVMHEAIHAAVHHAIENDPRLKADIKALHNEVANHFAEHAPERLLDYGIAKNEHEFISEAFSNPDFQQALHDVPVSPKLARQLGLGEGKFNAWSSLLAGIRKWLGWGKGEHHALDALMNVGRRAFDEGNDARPVGGGKRALESRDVTSWVRDVASRPDLMAKGRWLRHKTDTLTMLGQRAGKLGTETFGALGRKVAELVNRQDVERSKLLEREGGVLDTTREMARLAREHGEAYTKAVDLLFDASEANVNLGASAKNDHLGKDATSGWQAKERLKELNKRYAALPKELQDHIQHVSSMLKEERDFQVRDLIDKMLDASDAPATPGLADRIFERKTTDADKQLFKTNKVLDHLDRIAQQYKREGMYAPFMRDGDYVVNGYVPVTAPKGAMMVGRNKVRFVGKEAAARKAAKAFVESHDLSHIDTEGKWVDAADHTKIVEDTDPNAVRAYDVTLQDQHTQFFRTIKEAQAAAEHLESRGLKEVSVDLRRDLEGNGFKGLMPSQFESMVTALQGDKRFERLAPGQKAMLEQTLREVGTRLLPGNRIQKHSLERANVMGYSRDLVTSVARYGQMSASFRAKAKYGNAINDALTGMAKEIDRLNSKDDVKIRMREIQQEMARRAVMGPYEEGSGPMSTFSRVLNKISMLDKLAGPSFHIINAQEPWTTSLPVIGGRHGMLRAANALRQVYSAIGARSAVTSGVRDTFHAYTDDHGFTDHGKSFKEAIIRNVGGDKARRWSEALDHLHDTNLMGHEAGMEVQHVANPASGLAMRTLDRADLMARQMGASIEAINRAVTGLAAYEMEFKKNGGNHEAALQYMHDVVHDTMGNYSAANASPYFNSNVGRIALQFKKFAQKTYYLLGKSFEGMLRRDPEAAKTFMGLMVTHGVVAGALGLPLEPLKAAMIASNAMGLTNTQYDDFEQAVRQTAAQVLGKTGGEMFSRGVTRGLGFDTNARQGLDNLLTGFGPRSNKVQDLKAYAFDVMGGPGGGYFLQQLQAAQDLWAGNYAKGLQGAIPLKAARDLNKAITGYAEGKSFHGRQTSAPYSAREAITRAFGFTPQREAEEFEQQKAFKGDQQAAKTARSKQLADALAAKNLGDGWKTIQKWNQSQPEANRIAYKDLMAAKKRRDTEDKNGTVVRGMRVDKRSKAAFDQAQETYNVR